MKTIIKIEEVKFNRYSKNTINGISVQDSVSLETLRNLKNGDTIECCIVNFKNDKQIRNVKKIKDSE